jgi:hypothetical protein
LKTREPWKTEKTRHPGRRTSTARLQVVDGLGNDGIRVCRRNERAGEECDGGNEGDHDGDGLRRRWVVDGTF